MKGSYSVTVQNRRVQYKFTLNRNITVLRGDSALYFSWERFFTAVLTDNTKGTYLEYRKSKLNKNYLHITERNSILGVLPPMK